MELKGLLRQLVGVPQIPRSYLDQTVCLPAWFGSPDLHTHPSGTSSQVVFADLMSQHLRRSFHGKRQ